MANRKSTTKQSIDSNEHEKLDELANNLVQQIDVQNQPITDVVLLSTQSNGASEKKTIKRVRKPQTEANVSILIHRYTDDMYHVYAKQGHSIVAVYGFIISIDSFMNLAPTTEIAKAWGSMYDMVKANTQQVGIFQPTIANNISFVNSLVSTVIKAQSTTIVVQKAETSN